MQSCRLPLATQRWQEGFSWPHASLDLLQGSQAARLDWLPPNITLLVTKGVAEEIGTKRRNEICPGGTRSASSYPTAWLEDRSKTRRSAESEVYRNLMVQGIHFPTLGSAMPPLLNQLTSLVFTNPTIRSIPNIIQRTQYDHWMTGLWRRHLSSLDETSSIGFAISKSLPGVQAT